MSSQIILKYNPKLKDRARELRANMTEAEVKLWRRLRKKQIEDIRFLRQRAIGNYIVDFYAPEMELVIEVDGGHHFQDDEKEYDTMRDDYLEGLGLSVVRFSNTDVLKHMDGVLEKITDVIINNKRRIKKLN